MNIEMNDFVGNILQDKFYACCYIFLSGTRPKRYAYLSAALCYSTLTATSAETSLLLTALSTSHPITLQMGIAFVIVVA